MKKIFVFVIGLMSMHTISAQTVLNDNTANDKIHYHTQNFGIQGGLSLLENPFVLYPILNFSYSKTIVGFKKHQLAILPQLGVIILPSIETKLLFSTSIQYKYVSKKRFEANIFLGANYQLRKLDYDRYQFDGNVLTNKGKYLHQLGPILGLNVGYKVIKKAKYAISPTLGISLTKLNKNYQPNLFTGYKPSFTFGIIINK